MTKAEARRMLNCKDDYELAFQLQLAHTTIWRWKRMIPEKYRYLVNIRAQSPMVAIDVPVTRK